jgi:hypothetical protein
MDEQASVIANVLEYTNEELVFILYFPQQL